MAKCQRDAPDRKTNPGRSTEPCFNEFECMPIVCTIARGGFNGIRLRQGKGKTFRCRSNGYVPR